MAEIKLMEVVFPPTVITWTQKYGYLEASREYLRQEHNTKGDEFRDGKIDEETFRMYQAEVFGPKNTALLIAILDLRSENKNTAPESVLLDLRNEIKNTYRDKPLDNPLFSNVDLTNGFKEKE